MARQGEQREPMLMARRAELMTKRAEAEQKGVEGALKAMVDSFCQNVTSNFTKGE
jgi:hypothetical protein